MPRAIAVPAVLLGAHAAAIAWIAESYRRSDNRWLLLAVAALPMAQCSLLAAWLARGNWPAYLRAAVVAVGVATLWFVECQSLNLDLTDERCAAYALMFSVQTMLIISMSATIRLGEILLLRSSRCQKEAPGWRMQFTVRSTLGWIAAVAVVLGVARFVAGHADWSLDVIHSTLFLFGAVVGTYNASFALLAFASIGMGGPWYRLSAQVLVATVLISVIASSESVVLSKLFGTNGNVQPIEWIKQARFQVMYLWATLVPFRLWGTSSNRGVDPWILKRYCGMRSRIIPRGVNS